MEWQITQPAGHLHTHPPTQPAKLNVCKKYSFGILLIIQSFFFVVKLMPQYSFLQTDLAWINLTLHYLTQLTLKLTFLYYDAIRGSANQFFTAVMKQVLFCNKAMIMNTLRLMQAKKH